MNVNQMMAALRYEQKHGNGKLPVMLFAHDHDPESSEQGDGEATSCYECTNDAGVKFVAIRG